MTYEEAEAILAQYGQSHVLRFWDVLDESERAALLAQVASIDFPLMARLIDTWVLNEPAEEHFTSIRPVDCIPGAAKADPAAWAAGEAALRAGRVGLVLVAGGQGTRLGFPGPKGAYPIGPISGKSLFAFHAEKIRNLQRRYECVLPWYIMVSDTNKEETRAFFAENGFFGLNPADVTFFTQRMVPCVDEAGKFILEDRASLAMNPNGHGGSIPALVDNGIIADAKARGIDTLTYFQVDNLAAKVADPLFIGYHIQRNAEMSSKCHRKNKPREAVGVHCICDGGEYRVIEYTELDIYPQLLETDDTGEVVYYAGNPAIHILSTGFVERIYNEYDQFPWHRAHKKISFVNDAGEKVSPEKPNGYKFETFVFDALRFVAHEPVALEMGRAGEYTPIKQFEGDNSVVAAWNAMRAYWGEWLEAAGCVLPRNADGAIAAKIEISPEFALTKDEFVAKTAGYSWPAGDIGIAADGSFIRPCNG